MTYMRRREVHRSCHLVGCMATWRYFAPKWRENVRSGSWGLAVFWLNNKNRKLWPWFAENNSGENKTRAYLPSYRSACSARFAIIKSSPLPLVWLIVPHCNNQGKLVISPQRDHFNTPLEVLIVFSREHSMMTQIRARGISHMKQTGMPIANFELNP